MASQSPASRLFIQLLFSRRSKKTSKLRVPDLCAGNSSGTGEFPAQMTSNAENVSISWRHHELYKNAYFTKKWIDSSGHELGGTWNYPTVRFNSVVPVKIVATLKTFSNSFSCMAVLIVWLKSQWNLLPVVQLCNTGSHNGWHWIHIKDYLSQRWPSLLMHIWVKKIWY